MHVFVDFCVQACAGVAYLKSINKKGNIVSSFVNAKPRLVPVHINIVSVLKLELQSVIIADRTKTVVFWKFT